MLFQNPLHPDRLAILLVHYWVPGAYNNRDGSWVLERTAFRVLRKSKREKLEAAGVVVVETENSYQKVLIPNQDP